VVATTNARPAAEEVTGFADLYYLAGSRRKRRGAKRDFSAAEARK